MSTTVNTHAEATHAEATPRLPSGRSLRWRLLAATLAGVGLALVLAGVGLQSLFRDHVQRQYQAALEEHLNELATRLAFDAQGQPRLDAGQLSDPRWQRPLSGQYWQVDGPGADGAWRGGVLRSRSLWDTQLQAPRDDLSGGQLHVHEVDGPGGARLLLVERVVRPAEADGAPWRLLVAGDAAHIVPPTGAKGLNLAASDVHYAADALTGYLRHGDADGIASYSSKALARVWKSERFSWSLTKLMHRFPEDGPFERAMQVAELDYIASSVAAQTTIAENYVGLPV